MSEKTFTAMLVEESEPKTFTRRIVSRSLAPLPLDAFRRAGEEVAADVEARTGRFYRTRCSRCGSAAQCRNADTSRAYWSTVSGEPSA